MSMIAVDHQSCGVVGLWVADMLLLLIWRRRAQAHRIRAWKIQVQPGDHQYRRRAPAAAMPVADPRSPAGSPTARRARDDRPRARIEGLEQSSLDDLRMLEHGGHVEHFAGGNAALVEESRPFLRRSHRERLLDLSLQFEPTALAILARGEARIGGELTAADQPAQRLELLLLVRSDVQKSLAGSERARGARRHVLVAHGLGSHARDQPIRNRPAHG